MKSLNIIWILTFCLTLSSYTFAQKGNVEVTGTFTEANCPLDSIFLYQWTGAMPEPIQKAKFTTKDGKKGFSFSLPAGSKGYYFIGAEPMHVKLFVVNDEKTVSFSGSCSQDLAQLTVVNSPANAQLESINARTAAINNRFFEVINSYRSAGQDPILLSPLNDKMKKIDEEKQHVMDSLKRKNNLLYRVFAYNTYLSYQHNKENNTQTEAEYFAVNFLKFVDTKDTSNWRLPAFSDAYKNYAANMSKLGLTNNDQRLYINKELARLAPNSLSHRAAMFGILLGSMGNNNSSFAYFGKEYLKIYEASNAPMANFVKEQIAGLGVIVGEEAPEIKEVNPDGKMISTNDFRGNFLIIDFWASWCGPCRRVNPHLVELYHKYKDKGLNILGVSLDRSKEAWIGAINQDKLEWSHVSDLNQWASKWAKLYGVNSVPHALLIDKNGVVVGKQMSPPELDAKLREVYGF